METSPSVRGAPAALTPGIVAPGRPRARRLESVDAVRGIVMIVMALDHVRDYFGAATVIPTDLATTTVPLFFTRWVTHFCAPTFFLLTGVGAYLRLSSSAQPLPLSSSAQPRGGSPQPYSNLSKYLAVRGLWLILLDTVILRCLAYQFNFDFQVTFLIILWALGWSMITLSFLLRFPPRVAGIFGLALIIGHNLLDGISIPGLGLGAGLWRIVHQPGPLYISNGHFIILGYPLVPWIGVTAVGYALGQIFEWESDRRRAFLARVGMSAIAAFVLLRALNIYGDPFRWSTERLPVLSFLNTTKYPPSLLFLLMTLSPMLLVLRSVDREVPRVLRPAITYGRVPLFYFALHFVLIHALVVLVGWFRYDGDASWAFQAPTPDKTPFAQPKDWPASLPVIYGVWIGVVMALWPVCRWFAGVKARRRDWWLSYL